MSPVFYVVVVYFVSLLLTKCKLEVEVSGVESALQTCRTMLLIWKNLFEATSDRYVAVLFQAVRACLLAW
jgi:hypothetical protein